MKVNCVSCGHVIDLRDSYDNYEGQIKCFTCGSLLDIRTEDGQVKHVEIDRELLQTFRGGKRDR